VRNAGWLPSYELIIDVATGHLDLAEEDNQTTAGATEPVLDKAPHAPGINITIEQETHYTRSQEPRHLCLIRGAQIGNVSEIASVPSMARAKIAAVPLASAGKSARK
jgi:hypothetical protein